MLSCFMNFHFDPACTTRRSPRRSPHNSRRISTCKTVSEQTTLPPFRINTYAKTRHAMKHVCPEGPSGVRDLSWTAFCALMPRFPFSLPLFSMRCALFCTYGGGGLPMQLKSKIRHFVGLECQLFRVTRHPQLATSARPSAFSFSSLACYRQRLRGKAMSVNKVTIRQGSASRRSVATRDLSALRPSLRRGNPCL